MGQSIIPLWQVQFPTADHYGRVPLGKELYPFYCRGIGGLF